MKWVTIFLTMIALMSECALAQARGAAKVELEKTPTGWRLVRNGEPYFIRGAGGDASKQLLKDIGGNSFRTWDAANIGEKLDEAHRLGMTVTVGMWMGHESRGFDYNSSKQVNEQFERCRQFVLQYRDHPALLMWAIGNEMEGDKAGDNPAIWRAVNDIATMVKQADPNHPTMTVMMEIGGERVKCVQKYCPSIDVVGINSYGGATSVPRRYKAAGGIKPYVITEFGPPGVWETRDKKFGAPVELTSTQKAEHYRDAWKKGIESERERLCLGGYAFSWGSKQESTATWYGMILSNGNRTQAVDVLREIWTEKAAENVCPRIDQLRVVSAAGAEVEPGGAVIASLSALSVSAEKLTVRWELHRDSGNLETGGEAQPPTIQYPDAIVKSDEKSCELKMPRSGGVYRLYAFVEDSHRGAAVANVLLKVNGPEVIEPAPKVKLPMVIYRGGLRKLPYAATGYMGNRKAIFLDADCKEKPRAGETCLKIEYQSAGDWAGVSWQDPPNDWGDRPGGYDLSGARRLTFWARGEKGGEQVRFTLGGIGGKKSYRDSAKGELLVELTREWKQHSIDLSGLDLTRVKTPFAWFTVKVTAPFSFYLDEILYE